MKIKHEIVTAKILKIHAIGTYKRYMKIQLENGFTTSIRIPQDLYKNLRECNAITSQSLRVKKQFHFEDDLPF